jgi:hypothetical protein
VNGRSEYCSPRLTYHGRVEELTLSEHHELGVHAFQMAAAFGSSVIATQTTPSGSGTQNVPQGGGGGGGVPGATAPLDTTGSVPTGGGGGSVPGGTINETIPSDTTASTPVLAAGEAPSSGRLPFTGFAVALVAGAGLAAASGGAALRRLTRRGPGGGS